MSPCPRGFAPEQRGCADSPGMSGAKSWPGPSALPVSPADTVSSTLPDALLFRGGRDPATHRAGGVCLHRGLSVPASAGGRRGEVWNFMLVSAPEFPTMSGIWRSGVGM